jgi:small subunit ribosomal protein S17
MTEKQKHTGERGLRKSREGVVVSNKMTKTVIVAVVRQVKHEAYGKYIRKTSTHFAHDEKNECQIGDRVRIVETRPMSKNKRWKVETVLAKAAITA